MRMHIGGEFVCASASAICLQYPEEISHGTTAHFSAEELRDSLIEVCTELSRQRSKFEFLDKEHRDHLAANEPRPQTSACSQTDPPPPSPTPTGGAVSRARTSVASAPGGSRRPPRAKVRGCGATLAPQMCVAYARGECMHGKRCFHMHDDTDAERQRATRRRAIVARGLASKTATPGPAQQTRAGPASAVKLPERVWRRVSPPAQCSGDDTPSSWPSPGNTPMPRRAWSPTTLDQVRPEPC